MAFWSGRVAHSSLLLRPGNSQHTLEKSAASRDCSHGCRSDPWPTSYSTVNAAPRANFAGFRLRSGQQCPANGLRLSVPGFSHPTWRTNGNGGSSVIQQSRKFTLGYIHLLGGKRAHGTVNAGDASWFGGRVRGAYGGSLFFEHCVTCGRRTKHWHNGEPARVPGGECGECGTCFEERAEDNRHWVTITSQYKA